MKKRINYVNNTDLKTEIENFLETGEYPEALHLYFYQMATKISSKGNYSGYTWKEDMISTAYLKCLHVVKKFDIERPNPFAYFTTVITNCFIDYLTAEKKQKNIKDKARDIYSMEMIQNHGIRLPQYEDAKKRQMIKEMENDR